MATWQQLTVAVWIRGVVFDSDLLLFFSCPRAWVFMRMRTPLVCVCMWPCHACVHAHAHAFVRVRVCVCVRAFVHGHPVFPSPGAAGPRLFQHRWRLFQLYSLHSLSVEISSL